MKEMLRTLNNQRGVALITMLLLLSALTILAVGSVYVSSIDTQLAGNFYQNSRAFYAAEAGVEKALSDIQTLLDGTGAMTDEDLASILPPDIDDFTWEEYSVVRASSSFVDTVTTGPFQGMVSLNQPITITSKVLGPKNSRYHIIVEVEGIQIPVFQFGVFYNDSLEIHNGPTMDFIGRVHTNSELFLGTNNTTRFHKMITLAGDLYRFRIWNGETFGGSILISDPDSNFVALTYDSGTYAGNDAGFVTQTNADFNGRLRTRAHNITPLGMPITTGLDPIEIIGRRNAGDDASLVTERLDWKADTRVYANAALSSISTMNKSGNPKILNDPTAVYASYDAFYDNREGQWTDLLVIDVSKLTAADLDDGVLYASIDEQAGRHKGIKLINASSLPAPMSVASDNAIYVQGDYNTVNWQPSAVMGDAVYLLSNSWSDAANHNTSSGLQTASSTTYYMAMISGDTPNASAYNGGLENFPRFLESWSGRTATIHGSFVNLFLSQRATGQWSYGGSIYTAPTRNWWFEIRFLDFNNLPPGTPSVGTVLRIAFRQEFFI
jgi:hypothetical protein